MTNTRYPISIEPQQEAQQSAPILPNTYYETAPDGTEYFCCGKNRIQVSEHFAASGKHIGELIQNVSRYAAKHTNKLATVTL